MELQLRIIGFLFTILALIHIGFPRYFKWKEDLKSLSLISRQLMEVHTFFIGLTVLLMGLLCISLPEDLIGTALGTKICFGFGLFWAARLYFQLFVYSPKLWRGKTFETTIHIVFTIFWIYLSFIFLYISFS